MDARGRPDRSGIRGLKVASRGDLIEDIHRQHRRRVLKRAAQLTALAIALLLVGIAFKVMADRRARSQALDNATQHFVEGTVGDVKAAVEVLDRSLAADPDHDQTLAAHALVRAHLFTEFGADEPQARAAVGAIAGDSTAGTLAQGLLAFADGDLETTAERLEAIDEGDLSEPLVVGEHAWLRAMLTAATAHDDEEKLRAAIEDVDAVLEQEAGGVAHRRVRSLLLLLADDHDESLQELAQAREQSPSHMGLAADEAYYNALMHQELAGVASVADQLLASDTDLSPRDRAHTQLARAVAHVRNGEAKEGLALLDEAWGGLAGWNLMARELAIQTALEAFEHEHIEQWVSQSELPEPEADVYRAWATLVKGDVMEALEQLAKLPQEHPRVAHLQALALVEQRRYPEAKPWIERTQKLLPSRNDVEVAAARVEAHIGDKQVALRKLEALAEEEPYAPRAWTGLGEAHLQQEEVDERKAKRAFERAIEREQKAAEAMLQLAKLIDNNRKKDAEAEPEALELLEKAAKANPHLPRYREELALYAMGMGYPSRALEILRELADAPGVAPKALLALAELEVEAGETDGLEDLLDKAAKLGADPAAVERERARLLLASDDKEKIAEAQAKLVAILDKKPDDVEARVMYARAHLRLFDRKEAESAVRRGFATTPSDQQGRLHFAWAQIEARTGKRAAAAPRARAAWNRMLDEDRPPRELLQVADLATRLWTRHKRDRVAVTIGKQLTERMPYHSEAWTIRAEAELVAADAGDVLRSAERAIEIDENNPRAHALLGHAQLRFGRKDKAREAYERAIELVEGTPAEKEYSENLRRL